MSQPTPTPLLKAKASQTWRVAAAATVITAATALTAGLAAPAISGYAAQPSESQVVAPRTVEQEVRLATGIADMIGLYGVGPVFQALRIAGFGNPKSIITTAVGLFDQDLAKTIGDVVDGIDAVVPIDARVPGFGPAGIYDSVNGLAYSGNAIFDKLPGGAGVALEAILDLLSEVGGEAAAENIKTLINQRRAVILGTGLGGTDAAMALNQMIKDVEKDSALWGEGSNGVTSVVAVLVRNPSRPGGGLLALVTPVSELVGLDFSNPDGGSYTNEVDIEVKDNPLNPWSDTHTETIATKVLNVSITDIGWKYDLVSDAPSTLNPLAWANSIAGVMMPTYLLPDDLSTGGAALVDLLGQAAPGLLNGATTFVDPFGGQGLGLLTQGTAAEGLENVLEAPINTLLGGVNSAIEGATGVDLGLKFPMEGSATYVTYDSDNLPLLEPFHVLPRLLGYTGMAAISTPTADSFEDVLTQMVAIGYQDVNVSGPNVDGVVNFTRGMDMAGTQSDQIFKGSSELTV